ncbi:MAG: hypothetical protein WCJ19_04890 [bacterium]
MAIINKKLILSLASSIIILILVTFFVLWFFVFNKNEQKTKITKTENSVLLNYKNGINLSNWWANSKGLWDNDYLKNDITSKDFQLMTAVNIDYVRIPIDPNLLIDRYSSEIEPQHLTDLKAIIELASMNKVKVILDIDISAGLTKSLSDDKEYLLDYSEKIKRLSSEFKKSEISNLIFEIDINTQDNSSYVRDKLLQSVRLGLPENTIIVDVPYNKDPKIMSGIKTYEDNNVVYGIKFYEPAIFTLADGDVNFYEAKMSGNLVYPYDKDSCDLLLSKTPDVLKKNMQDYCNNQWNIDKLEPYIKNIADFAVDKNIIITEYGSPAMGNSSSQSRINWITDVTNLFDKYNIKNRVFDSYLYGFSLVDENEQTHIRDYNVNVLKALKLLPAKSLVPVYRFYNETAKTYFYTADEGEKNEVIKKYTQDNARYEDISFYVEKMSENACPNGTSPVFRFYNYETKNHFYTTDIKEKNDLFSKSSIWQYDGARFCADIEKKIGNKPIYRYYNISTNSYYFAITDSEKDEFDNNSDWINQGIAFYAYMK